MCTVTYTGQLHWAVVLDMLYSKARGVLRKKSIEAVLEEPKALPCWAVWLHSLAADTLTYSKISPLWLLWQPKRNLLLLIRSCNK